MRLPLPGKLLRLASPGAGLAIALLAGCAPAEGPGLHDPGDELREEVVRRVGPPSRASERTVRCACDAEGGLHVRAPAGSAVTIPEDSTFAAEAEIVVPEDGPRPIRRTKSLGFIGDNPLTPTPSRGGPWAVPDAVMPLHRHSPRPPGAYGGGWAPPGDAVGRGAYYYGPGWE